jgi:hypothetical protein
MIKNFRHLNTGATFYLPEYPGNTYRKAGLGSAELVISRHNNQWNGSILRDFGTDRLVATDPFDEALACECCGDPVDHCDSLTLCQMCHSFIELHPPQPQLEGLELL